MDVSPLVHVFEPSDGLVGDEQHRLEGEPASTKRKQIFEGRPQEFCYQHHVVVLLSKPEEFGEPETAL